MSMSIFALNQKYAAVFSAFSQKDIAFLERRLGLFENREKNQRDTYSTVDVIVDLESSSTVLLHMLCFSDYEVASVLSRVRTQFQVYNMESHGT